MESSRRVLPSRYQGCRLQVNSSRSDCRLLCEGPSRAASRIGQTRAAQFCSFAASQPCRRRAVYAPRASHLATVWPTSAGAADLATLLQLTWGVNGWIQVPGVGRFGSRHHPPVERDTVLKSMCLHERSMAFDVGCTITTPTHIGSDSCADLAHDACRTIFPGRNGTTTQAQSC